MSFIGRHIHFIGVGGVGMSGLATILLQRGVGVSGSDAAASPVLERLERLGAKIATGHAVANVPPETDQVVFSSAVQPSNPEMQEAARRHLPTCRRGEFLARLAELFPVVVAIGGSHGKTTTSAMIAHILREAGRRPGFMIGGEMPGWPAPAAAGAGEILVTEVDESDGTQALVRSSHAIVTNVDDDHCWSLGGVAALEHNFIDFARKATRLFTWNDDTTARLFARHPAAAFITPAEIPAGLAMQFLPGGHNRKNAAVAIAVTSTLGVLPAQAVAALALFTGVSRRLSERYCSPGAREVVVEDYAHHPNELRASLQALREQHPGARLTVIFQPHRFERVKRYAAEFSQILERDADEIYLIPPFAAWMQDVELADPREIVTAIRGREAVYWEKDLEDLAFFLAMKSQDEIAPCGGDAVSVPVRVRPCAAAASAQFPRRNVYAVVGAGDVGRLAGLLREELADQWLTRTMGELKELPELKGRCKIDRDRVWSELTTLGAGFGRPLVVYPETTAQLQAVLNFANNYPGVPSHSSGVDDERARVPSCGLSVNGGSPSTAHRPPSTGIPVAVLGCGSNLVGADWEPPRIWVCLRQGEFRGGSCKEETPKAEGRRQKLEPTAAPENQGDGVAVGQCGGGTQDNCESLSHGVTASQYEIETRLWTVGCGVTLRALFEAAAQAEYPCAEFAPLAWIPGTLGGAVRMNAGADGIAIGQFVTALEGVRLDGAPWSAAAAELPWNYRDAGIPDDVMVTSVTLRLPVSTLVETEERLRESGEKRRAAQPSGRSAGCVFKNPAPAASAGCLIDRTGCKGMAVGGANVSEKHANFILTDGHVSEKEFLSLLLRVRQRVFNQTGVMLMPEVKFAGAEAEQQVLASIAPPHVVVLKGGPSSEREISLRSGTGVANALREAGYRVTEIAFDKPELPELPVDFDVVFPVLHGAFGEDGQIQALMDARKIRYVGSGPVACKMIMDKLATKRALAAAGVPTAKWAVLEDASAPMPPELKFPVVVKPNEQGSSIGISKVAVGDAAGWKAALEKAFALDPVVFCEEFVKGTEITVGLLDGRALPVVEIKPVGDKWYDYDAKYVYQDGKTEYLCPPQNIAESVQQAAQAFAEQGWTALGAKDLLRIDFIVDAQGTPWCLEANAIPGFTATSLLPKSAAVSGLSFAELCAKLVKANL